MRGKSANRIELAAGAKRSALTGAAAISALAGLGPQARAATLYVASEGGNEIYQFPNAAIANGTTAASAANDFASLTAAPGVSVDPSGNVVAVSFSGTTGTAHSYSSAGSPLATSSAIGNNNWNGIVYNNNLYTSMYSATSLSPTSYAGIVVTPYSYSAGAASFPGSPAPITIVTTTSNGTGVFGMALVPSNQSVGNTTSNPYLFYVAGGSPGYLTVNALNLSNNNTVALTTPYSGGTQKQIAYGLAYDPYNGNLYGVSNVSGSTPFQLFQLAPTYSNGTLASIAYSTISVTVGTATHGGLDNPVGAAFGPDGNLYIGEANDDEVDVINVDGNPASTQQLDYLNEYASLSSSEAEPCL